MFDQALAIHISGGPPSGLDIKSLTKYQYRICNGSAEWISQHMNPSEQQVSASLNSGSLVLNIAVDINHPFNYAASGRFAGCFVDFLKLCNVHHKFPPHLLSKNIISDVFHDRFIMVKRRVTSASKRRNQNAIQAQKKRVLSRRARVSTLLADLVKHN